MNYKEFFRLNLLESSMLKNPVEMNFGSTRFELMMTWMNARHSKIVMISPQLTNKTIKEKNNNLKTKQNNQKLLNGGGIHLI